MQRTILAVRNDAACAFPSTGTLARPLRLVPLDEAAGQFDVDRFNDSRRSFFDEASGIDTQYVA